MSHRIPSMLLAAGALLALASPAAAQEDLIANALSAAPAAIAADAAVMDGEGNVLREGSNGYTCFPDDPSQPGNAPMCLDETWMKWAGAWMNKTDPPPVKKVSVAYMLQDDAPVSNTDPYATEPTADNEWIENTGPHLMILVPDAKSLEGLSDDPGPGPFVMWKGTPYVHLMVPTAGHSM